MQRKVLKGLSPPPRPASTTIAISPVFLAPTLRVGTPSSPLCGAKPNGKAINWQVSVRAAERPDSRSHAERGNEEA